MRPNPRTPIERMIDEACGYDSDQAKIPSPNLVILRCLQDRCPRTLQIQRPLELGKNVAEIHSFCPEHAKSGGEEYPEKYYDIEGKQLDWETIVYE